MADTSANIEIERLDAARAETITLQFITLLQDGVATASLGFWNPLDQRPAEEYWREVIAEMRAGQRWMLAALRDGALVGSVQLAASPKQNAAHRAEVQKLMVFQNARRQGIGQRLMQAVERLAAEQGKSLLFLDTNTGSDAEQFYRAQGYMTVGVIPAYTTERDGSEHATTVFYKRLGVQR